MDRSGNERRKGVVWVRPPSARQAEVGHRPEAGAETGSGIEGKNTMTAARYVQGSDPQSSEDMEAAEIPTEDEGYRDYGGRGGLGMRCGYRHKIKGPSHQRTPASGIHYATSEGSKEEEGNAGRGSRQYGERIYCRNGLPQPR